MSPLEAVEPSNLALEVYEKMQVHYPTPQVSITKQLEAIDGRKNACGEVKVSMRLRDSQGLPDFVTYDAVAQIMTVSPSLRSQTGNF